MNEFINLPDEARIWIHGSRRPLTQEQRKTIEGRLEPFVLDWKSHGNPVTASYAILEDRFLVTAAHCGEDISGCSIDSYIRNLRWLREKADLNLLDGGLVFFRDREGEIQGVPHLEFFDLVESGDVSASTAVFDTLLQNLGELRQGAFEKSFAQSWHSQTYGKAQTAH